jgi:transcriptional regulator with GAF, ATPase, and Fis domain
MNQGRLTCAGCQPAARHRLDVSPDLQGTRRDVPSFDPAPEHPDHALVAEFAEIAAHVHSSEDYEASLRQITEAAVHALDGCDYASVSLLERTGPVTRAATDPVASAGDQIQYDEGEGPCLDAAMHERWVHTPDLSESHRWPRSSARLVSQLGVRSMFSCRLALDAAPHQTLGGLNLYAMAPDAFSEQDRLLAILLASLGAVVADASRQQANLRAAVESRQVIGEAIGILRAQGGLSSDQAFAALSSASQRMNVKLRDLAGEIATRGGQDSKKHARSREPGISERQ